MSESLAIAEIIKLREELEKVHQELNFRRLTSLTSDTDDEPAQIIANAVDAIEAAYWMACERGGRALDPKTLGAPKGLLDDAFSAAQEVEATVKKHGISWVEARETKKP